VRISAFILGKVRIHWRVLNREQHDLTCISKTLVGSIDSKEQDGNQGIHEKVMATIQEFNDATHAHMVAVYELGR
jgi:hypothetical protein